MARQLEEIDIVTNIIAVSSTTQGEIEASTDVHSARHFHLVIQMYPYSILGHFDQ